MQYANLGRTGCKVSRLCLGTMNFGPRTNEVDSHAVLSEAIAQGINFWDTADVYGGKENPGLTETIIGKWFGQNPGQRDQVVLATKFQGVMGPGPNDRGASAYHIRAACEASLRRLKTDRLDLYQMHHINRDTSFEEVFEAIDVLVKQGKVVYSGSSNYAGWHIAQSCEAAKRLRVLGMVCEQSKFSLACRHIEIEVLPACRHYGVGVIAWSPLDGGLLGGVLGDEKGQRRDSEGIRKRIEQRGDQVKKWETFCKELGEKPAAVALAWLLQVPGFTAPIIGPRTVEQLRGSLRSLEIKLSADAVAKLNDIWPPAGLPEVQQQKKLPYYLEAPEAYAF